MINDHKVNKFFVKTVLLSFLLSNTPFAAPPGFGNSGLQAPDFSKGTSGSVYLTDPPPIPKSMLSIRVVGSVARQGVHLIPAGTDLITLLSFAGGTTAGADLTEVTITHNSPDHPDKPETKEVDLKRILKSGKTGNLTLSQGDIVYFPTQNPLIDSNVMSVIGVIGSVTSILLTTLLLTDKLKPAGKTP